MITMQQAQAGLLKYIDTDIMPHLSGIKKIGLGVYAGLAGQNIAAIMERYRKHPAIEMLGVVDENGNIDIDALYRAALPMFAEGQKTAINLPLLGELTVDKSDLEKLYRYMRGQ